MDKRPTNDSSNAPHGGRPSVFFFLEGALPAGMGKNVGEMADLCRSVVGLGVRGGYATRSHAADVKEPSPVGQNQVLMSKSQALLGKTKS